MIILRHLRLSVTTANRFVASTSRDDCQPHEVVVENFDIESAYRRFYTHRRRQARNSILVQCNPATDGSRLRWLLEDKLKDIGGEIVGIHDHAPSHLQIELDSRETIDRVLDKFVRHPPHVSPACIGHPSPSRLLHYAENRSASLAKLRMHEVANLRRQDMFERIGANFEKELEEQNTLGDQMNVISWATSTGEEFTRCSFLVASFVEEAVGAMFSCVFRF